MLVLERVSFKKSPKRFKKIVKIQAIDAIGLEKWKNTMRFRDVSGITMSTSKMRVS